MIYHPSPFPSFKPNTPADYSALQIMHQMQTQGVSTEQVFLFGIIMQIPFIPLEWQLNLYLFLTQHPVPVISNWHPSTPTLTGLLIFWPVVIIALLVILYFAFKLLMALIRSTLPLALKRFRTGNKNEEQTFLQLTFPSDTSKSAYATEQLYKLLHTLSRKQGGFNSFLRLKKSYSLELAASRDSGIRYILAVPKKEADVIHRSLLSYLPGLKVKEIPDYLEEVKNIFNGPASDLAVGVMELKQTSDFTLPFQDQKILDEHDSISFLAGNMTKLQNGELLSLQIVTTPLLSHIHTRHEGRISELNYAIHKGKPIEPILQKKSFWPLSFTSLLLFIFSPLLWLLIIAFKLLISLPDLIFNPRSKTIPIFQSDNKVDLQQILNPYEQELSKAVKEKTDQHLYETSIRFLIVARDKIELESRADGLYASLGQFSSSYQSLSTKGRFFGYPGLQKRLVEFKERSISDGFFRDQNPVLSTSEISDLYHFPYTDITKVEGMIKSRSKDLPAPLSMKKSDTNLDIIVGNNSYGGENTPIGISLEQRQRHTYVIGKTGMGKTEMLKNMIYQDMVAGKGLAVLDPHGDLFHELLGLVPKKRIKDVVVFNPADKDFPVGLNILASGIQFTDPEEGQDRIVSTTLSVFQKITDDKYWGPRLEHILRNTAQTALFTPTPSFWTVQRLLTSDKGYQKQVTKDLEDPILKQFWQSEFALYGKMQQGDVISPITNKIGKFITSHMSRNILLQPKSTFNIQEVMDSGKILLVNLSKGELGEDQSHFFGSLIISLIQLAAYERIHIPESKRKDFFLYVDEFQNFATHIFEELSSEGRKWHVPLIPSHQNIAQIRDPHLLKIVAGNADTFIALKSGPDDEKFILPFMEPEVEKGAIVNLPPYHFYMKVTNKDSEDAFSGETELLDIEPSEKIAKEVIDYSRKHYATPRNEVESYLNKLFKGNGGTKTEAVKPEEEPIQNSNKTTGKKSKKRLKRSKKRYI